jgi:hypothetical protein
MSSISQVSAAMQRILDTRARGMGTADRICATLECAVGWTGLCANMCLDVDAASRGQLFAVAAHGRQDGGFM